ncbi:hypothetical protein [Cytobacillus gottheilii]|uniref:hypothetical protein n=1 Tax=Cytobacillus gottheilii TaxID=859144 RepID=UPI0009BC66FA|nr:hypothetical protein [Cytobacillus gottheilii]
MNIENKDKIIDGLKKTLEVYSQALDDIKNVSTLDEYQGSNASLLLKACYDIAKTAKPQLG